ADERRSVLVAVEKGPFRRTNLDHNRRRPPKRPVEAAEPVESRWDSTGSWKSLRDSHSSPRAFYLAPFPPPLWYPFSPPPTPIGGQPMLRAAFNRAALIIR